MGQLVSSVALAAFAGASTQSAVKMLICDWCTSNSVVNEFVPSIDCVMFSREATRLKWTPADGQLVRCRGRLTIYEGRGKFQMTVTALERWTGEAS